TLLVRCDVARVTIVAVPRHTVVAVPRRTDPHAARADRAPEMRKACGADARRDRNSLWPRNRRPDHRGSESATKGHGMAASKCAPTSGGGFDRCRNQAGRENCEEPGRNSNGHRKLLPTHFIPAHSLIPEAAVRGRSTLRTDHCGEFEGTPSIQARLPLRSQSG